MIVVVKIHKSYRNGSKEHLLVIQKDYDISSENIDYFVEEWCESDGCGLNYGYEYEWSIVTDESIKKDALLNELNNINRKIDILINNKNEIEQFLNS